MNKTLNIILIVTLVVMVGGLTSCGEEKPPAPPPQVVSQKITQEAKPQKTDQSQAKPAHASSTTVAKDEDVAAPKPTPGAAKPEGETTPPETAAAPPAKSQPAPEKEVGAKPEEKAAPVTSELIKASLEMASTYDPTGRIDPFTPLFSEEPEKPVVASTKTSKKKRRTPQTPLERVSLSQLKLTAVMRMPQGNRALVEDATGKGYVVQKGTYMGLNAGQVIKIDKDSLVVEEEIQNMVGDYIINNTELKLQKPAGDK